MVQILDEDQVRRVIDERQQIVLAECLGLCLWCGRRSLGSVRIAVQRSFELCNTCSELRAFFFEVTHPFLSGPIGATGSL